MNLPLFKVKVTPESPVNKILIPRLSERGITNIFFQISNINSGTADGTLQGALQDPCNLYRESHDNGPEDANGYTI